VNFLEYFIQKSKRSQALIYAFALLLLIAIVTIWFSSKADQALLNFLPAETSFYYQWQKADDQSQPIVDFLQNNLQTTAKADLDILGTDFLKQSKDIVWFKIGNSEVNYYLFKAKTGFNKKEIKNLLENKNFSWHLIGKQVLVLANQADLKLDFIIQDSIGIVPHFFNPSGENIFFSTQKPEFLTDILAQVGDKALFSAEKLWWQIDTKHNLKQINIYQLNTTQEDVDSAKSLAWKDLKIISKPRLLLFGQNLSEASSKFLQENILSIVNTQAPHLKFGENFWQNYADNSFYFFDQDGDWYLSKAEDWYPALSSLNSEFEVITKTRSLPDGTLYTELLKNKEVKVESLAWQDKAYWKMKDFYGVDIANQHYLSNSENLVKDLLANSADFSDQWQNCELNEDEKLTNLIFLDKIAASQLNLGKFLGEVDKFVLLFEYQSSQTQGLRLCWQ